MEKPIALDAYEALADSYAAAIDTKPHNAYYERPATLSLLPEVNGLRVLEAGCGPGVYTEWLARHGAEVMALDVSPRMVQLARERVGDAARILEADFSRPLDFLDDSSFDLVLSALALDYVRDWPSVFGEFRRVLKAGGHFVFSVGHPFADFKFSSGGNYFETELTGCEWRGFERRVHMPWYRRPAHSVINTLLDAGFRLERVLEPVPTEEFKQKDPENYEHLSRHPGFLCVRAQKQR